MVGKTMVQKTRMRDKLLMISFCGAWLVACGDGDGGPSFGEMCDRGVTKLCEQINACGTSYPMSTCIAEMKAQNCANGPEQFCGAGSTYQPSKASACLAALNSARCELVEGPPAECSPEVVCSSSSGGDPIPGQAQGEACSILEPGYECDPKASTCYGAGKSSSCAAGGLCIGDSTGVFCAAHCTVDADCTTADAGLVCLQGCKASIINGFCVKPEAKTKFIQGACKNGSASTTAMSGWSV
jgi:hypothetical protein